MKVKNTSARLHHVGDTLLVPGETATIPDEWAGSITSPDLEVVEKPAAKPAAFAKPTGKGSVAPAPVKPAADPVAAAQDPVPAPEAPAFAAPAGFTLNK
jgi:hypothetical protein